MNDITRIADALERIAAAAETELTDRKEKERLKQQGHDMIMAGELKRAKELNAKK